MHGNAITVWKYVRIRSNKTTNFLKNHWNNLGTFWAFFSHEV